MGEIKLGQVYVKEGFNGGQGHKVFEYYFVTGVSLNKDIISGIKIIFLCTLKQTYVNNIVPNYLVYSKWFEKAKLIDESQNEFLDPNKPEEKKKLE